MIFDLYLSLGLEKKRDLTFQSRFSPTPICYIGLEKKRDLAFFLPLSIFFPHLWGNVELIHFWIIFSTSRHTLLQKILLQVQCQWNLHIYTQMSLWQRLVWEKEYGTLTHLTMNRAWWDIEKKVYTRGGQPSACMRPASNYAARQAPRGKNNMDEYCVYLARVVGGARHKNHNSFSARGGKKVAHHWSIPWEHLVGHLHLVAKMNSSCLCMQNIFPNSSSLCNFTTIGLLWNSNIYQIVKLWGKNWKINPWINDISVTS